MQIEVDICSQTGAVQEMLKKVQVTKDKREHSWLLYATGWHVFLRRKCYVKSVKYIGRRDPLHQYENVFHYVGWSPICTSL